MDAAGAESLIVAAEEARAAMRRQDDAAVETFERSYPEMRSALDWLLEAGRRDDAFRLATALIPFWIATKRIEDGDSWYGRALPAATDADTRRPRATYDHGYLVFWAGRYDVSEDRFRAARAMAAATGDKSLVALTLAGSARVALKTDPSEAVRLLREALELTADLPDSEGHSSADHVLGVALQMSGDLAGARDVMVARLGRARSGGNEFVVMTETANLSMVERQLGDLDAAERYSLEALDIVSRKGDEMATPWILNGLAAVTAARGWLERAAVLHAAADALMERAGGEWPPDEREQFDETAAKLAAGMSADDLASARARGGAMTLREAVAFAARRDAR